MKVKITLVATDSYMTELFSQYCGWFDNVEVHFGKFEDLTADCLASPANGFGLMDGGMDAAITAYFGNQLQQRVQQKIIEEFYGEQPVGTSFIIDTRDSRIPFLAHTPTMRVPADVSDTQNAYLAVKATLTEVEKHSEVNSVILPAFAAGAGAMHRQEVARQTALAIKHMRYPPTTVDWDFARFRDYEIKGR